MTTPKNGFETLMERANEIQATLGNKTKHSTLSAEQMRDLLKEMKEIATKLEAYEKMIDNPNAVLDREIRKSFFSVAKAILSYTREHKKFFTLLERRFGTNYEDHDMDKWIDILDYGEFREEELTEELFREFMKDMQEVKENKETGGL